MTDSHNILYIVYFSKIYPRIIEMRRVLETTSIQNNWDISWDHR